MAKSVSKKVCPLFQHKHNGQWSKKILGKTVYFGADKAVALARWEAEKDRRLAGLPVVRDGQVTAATEPTIAELANVFIDAKKRAYEVTGKPGKWHLDLLEETIERLIAFLGPSCDVSKLSPTDFARIKLHLFSPVKRTKPVRGKVWGLQVKRRAPSTVGGDVRRIKSFLNWCHDKEHIAEPRYGDEFSAETQVAITKETLRKKLDSRKDFSAAEVHAVLGHCAVNYRPLVLLAINGGLGQGDIAAIELEDIKGIKGGWLPLPRLKTGVNRKLWLWPETVKAIQDYLKVRPEPSSDKYQNVVFLTRHRYPWIRGDGRERIDSIGTTFFKIRKLAGVPDRVFYDFRRTFATVASDANDHLATRFCMGHAPDKKDTTAGYIQGVPDDRVKRVCEHVRGWLYKAK